MKSTPPNPAKKSLKVTPASDAVKQQGFPAAPSQPASQKKKPSHRHYDPLQPVPGEPVSPLVDRKLPRAEAATSSQPLARTFASEERSNAPRHSTPVNTASARPLTPPPTNSPPKPVSFLVRRTKRVVTVVDGPAVPRQSKSSMQPSGSSLNCPFPANVGMLSATLLHDRYIFVTGGCIPPSNTALKTVGCYDTATSSWVPCASDSLLRELPAPLYGHCSMTHGNSLWLIGGLSANDCAVKSIVHLRLEITSMGEENHDAAAFRILSSAVYPLEHPVAFASCVRLDGTLTPIAIVMCGLSSVRDNEVGAVATSGDGYECRHLGMTNRCFAVHFDDDTIYRVAQTGSCPSPRMFSAAATLTRSTVSDASSTIVLLGGICHPNCPADLADAIYVGTVEHNATYQTFSIYWQCFKKLSAAAVWPDRIAGYQLVSLDGYFLLVGASAKQSTTEGAVSDSSAVSSKSAVSQNSSRSSRSKSAAVVSGLAPWFALLYDATAGCSWIEVAPSDCLKIATDPSSDNSMIRQVSNLMLHSCVAVNDISSGEKGLYVVGGVPSNGRRSSDSSLMRFLPIQIERSAKPSPIIEYTFSARLELPEMDSLDDIFFSLRGSELSIDSVAAQLAKIAVQHVKNVPLETLQCNLLLYSRGVGPERVPMHRDDLLIKSVERFGSAIPVIAVLEKQITNFTILRELGRGANGVVFQAMCNDTGRFFALKKVRCRSPAARARLMQEIRLMRILKHKNIVNYIGIIDNQQQDESAMIMMEHVSVSEHSTLHDFCTAYQLPIRNIQIFTREVLAALEFLHSYNVVHQDVKGMNVLMSTEHLKLSDFGTAVQLLSEADQGCCGLGTPVFMAPEAIEDPTKVTTASDIWSLGCLVIEMCTQQFPWAGVALSRENLFFRLSAKEIPPLPSRTDFPKSGVQFLEACFQHDPSRRPTAKELTRHPFITDLVSDRSPPQLHSAADLHSGACEATLQTDSGVMTSDNGGPRSLHKRSTKK